MKSLFRFFAIAAAMAALIWVMERPGYDSACALLGAIVVVIGTFQATRGTESSQRMTQRVRGRGVVIQSGRDTKITGSSDKDD